jgi:hypothetical protein
MLIESFFSCSKGIFLLYLKYVVAYFSKASLFMYKLGQNNLLAKVNFL